MRLEMWAEGKRKKNNIEFSRRDWRVAGCGLWVVGKKGIEQWAGRTGLSAKILELVSGNAELSKEKLVGEWEAESRMLKAQNKWDWGASLRLLEV